MAILTAETAAARWRWPHFKPREFQCRCGGRYPGCEVLRIDEALLDLLEALRADLGDRPVRITSGYRCPEHNRAVGGTATSQHAAGLAADIVVAGVAPEAVAAAAEKRLPGTGGIGRYPGFTHVDVRAGCARWRGGGG